MSANKGEFRTVELGEHDQSEPLELPEEVVNTIDNRINEQKQRIDYEFTKDGKVILQTSSYVGLISLPNDTQIHVEPKAAGDNFLRLLLYANGASSQTIDSIVRARSGELFLDAIGALFLDRLQAVLRRGLVKDYRTRKAREGYLRGQLDLQRQLSRGDVSSTKFELKYDELTHDTIENQSILYATHLLMRLVEDSSLKGLLAQREQQFRREVTLRPIHPSELDAIHLDRLNEHYEDILHIASLVIQSTFVDNLEAGTQELYGLLINMNRIFERVVIRVAREAFSDHPWHVEVQSAIDGIVTKRGRPLDLYPDFVLRSPDGVVQLIGDAKWKIGSPSRSDIYQMTIYQLADDVNGLLVYPSQKGAINTEYEIDDRLSLHLRELPTDRFSRDFNTYIRVLEGTLLSEVNRLIESPRTTI